MDASSTGKPLRWLQMTGLACAALLPLTVFAELDNGALLGLGLRSRPAYDGSATQALEAVPVVRQFGPLGFVRSTQGVLEAGLRIETLPGLHAGVQLAYEPGRATRGADFLEAHGVANVPRGASVGVQLEWDHLIGPMPVTLLARLRKHTRSALGTQADLRLSAGVLKQGGFAAGLFGQAVWADRRATASLFGIDAAESTLTGLPAFAPGGGWLQGSLGVLWSFDLGPRWAVLGSLEARRQRGDAARSPLTQQAWGRFLTAGLAGRF